MHRRITWLALVASLAFTACGDDGGTAKGLDDFLPPVPAPTGEAPSVFAGVIDAKHKGELLPGEAASGMIGDLYIRNSKARFVIQTASRVIGVIPQGGNLIDAVPIDATGKPTADDHFGELSMIYLLGRTCEHQTVEVIQDGSGGGVAAIRARGVATANDFVNLKGIGLLNVIAELDPMIPDQVECATTYILPPDSDTLEVYWTLYNGGTGTITGPFASLNDTGGNIETWAPTRGFERLGIEAITGGVGPAPIEYDVYQGPGVAYGLLPRHADASAVNSAYLIAGVSVILYGTDEFLKALRPEGYTVHMDPKGGVTNRLDFVVGHDAADVEEGYARAIGADTVAISGTAKWASGPNAAGARVGLFEDTDGDGKVGKDDLIRCYFDVGEDGKFAGRVRPGKYLVRADALDRARSAVQALDATKDQKAVAVSLPDPIYYDFSVVDDETNQPIPADLIVVGDHPAQPDSRLFSTYDRVTGVVDQEFAIHGTTVDMGDGADPRLALPAGGDYRLLASHGTEWSVADLEVKPKAGDPVQNVDLRLRHVVDTAGYIASEYHVHSIGSPDSPVDWQTRVASAAVGGVEVFASTEHEFIADLEPVAEALGLARWVRPIAGEEVSPFSYGHFIGFPLDLDMSSPNHGAIDWARNDQGFSLVPGEIFDELRTRGAKIVQVNHPRTVPGSFANFMQYFDRADLHFDYTQRVVGGDLNGQPVPNDYLRLPPGVSMWDPSFNALEVWNSLAVADSDGDGVREAQSLDQVMRDWFNFLSFGMDITPMGNSDTHTVVKDPMGIPRTMVRVADDSADAVASGALLPSLYDTLTGRAGTPKDIVVTDGPMIRVTLQGSPDSVVGKTLDGSAGSVTLSINVQAATWAQFDTIELFANDTPEVGTDQTVLQPFACFTSRAPADIKANDPCALASAGGAQPLTVDRVAVGTGFERYETTLVVTVDKADILTRAGATGDDAWIVARARGQRGIYPIYNQGVVTTANLPTLVSGTADQIETALHGVGLPAEAFTAPIYVDFDGGGYLAPFAP